MTDLKNSQKNETKFFQKQIKFILIIENHVLMYNWKSICMPLYQNIKITAYNWMGFLKIKA